LAQYRSLLCPHHLALETNAREQNTHHNEKLKNPSVLPAYFLTTWQSVAPDCQWMRSGFKSPWSVSRHAFAPIYESFEREPVSAQAQSFLPKARGLLDETACPWHKNTYSRRQLRFIAASGG
jgi:hypothetical protein